jgi:hypothetical protein
VLADEGHIRLFAAQLADQLGQFAFALPGGRKAAAIGRLADGLRHLHQGRQVGVGVVRGLGIGDADRHLVQPDFRRRQEARKGLRRQVREPLPHRLGNYPFQVAEGVEVECRLERRQRADPQAALLAPMHQMEREIVERHGGTHANAKRKRRQ